jgi:hypothetical protein
MNRRGVSSENHFFHPYARFNNVRQQYPRDEAGNGGGDNPPANAWSTGFSRRDN